MYAIRIHEPGAAPVLQYEEVASPEPGPGEVRVRLRAAGVNHRDIWVREGAFGAFPEPLIPGSDGAGEIDALGPGARDYPVGQKVVINPGLSCGRCIYCLSGQQNSCPHYRILDGTYAEQVVVPVVNVVPMPSGLTFLEAASIGIPFVTAEDFLIRAQAAAGQTIVVWGANGGLGLATIQLAHMRRMRVIAVVRHANYIDRLKQYGATDVLVWDGASLLASDILTMTNSRGADIVVDSLGQATFGQSLDMLRRGGTVVTVGGTTGGKVTIDLGQVFRRRLTVLGAYMGSSSILPRLLPLFARGVLIPIIDRTFPLEQAAQAHQRMEEHGLFGNIVLDI
ncbi:MAG: zinc-binding dehydrogenase [Sulfobacillus thermotolerans]|uniref:NADPH:quinone reductase n=1 Tax=Sulfobacillus thermotolerans TaxID=338644 RepID=A0ABN5GXQ9_9FIRM|nr:NADPH:quinone reductase [Sulfobacillus thermotolerans]MCY0906922.1 zinc-binding dehydrogenase [Sulfobacillus thermotolerans]